MHPWPRLQVMTYKLHCRKMCIAPLNFMQAQPPPPPLPSPSPSSRAPIAYIRIYDPYCR